MTTTTLPTITHRIAYDATTRDYACYVSVGGDPEQYIGSASSYHAGELRCVEYKRELIDLDSRPVPRKEPSRTTTLCDDCAPAAALRGSLGPRIGNALVGPCACCQVDNQAVILYELKDRLPAWAETSPQPDDTLLDAAWRAYKATRDRGGADRMTWTDVVAIQRQFMPRCAAHGVHTSIKHNGNPICAQCIEGRGFNPPAMQLVA